MNTIRSIAKLLRQVPPILPPKDLCDKIQDNVNLQETYRHPTILRRLFILPTGRISVFRVVYAALVAMICVTSISYGAIKILKHMTADLVVIYDHSAESGTSEAYAFRPTITGEGISNQEEAREVEKEVLRLIEAGKAEEYSPGEYRATLSDGREVIYESQLPLEILKSENRSEKIKELTDELQKLKQEGQFERVFLGEVKRPHWILLIYKDTYTLSNGHKISLNSSERKRDREKQ